MQDFLVDLQESIVAVIILRVALVIELEFGVYNCLLAADGRQGNYFLLAHDTPLRARVYVCEGFIGCLDHLDILKLYSQTR